MKYNYSNYCNSVSGFVKYNQNLLQSHLQEDNNNNDINVNKNSCNVSDSCEVTFIIMYKLSNKYKKQTSNT